MRLGNRVTLLPVGVIGVAVSTASLSLMSRRAATGDRKGLLETLDHTLRLLVTLLIPATAGLILLAQPIVKLLFEYGEFTPERSTPMTTTALVYYSLGLPAYGLVRGLAQAYYAVQDTRTPVRVGVISVLANVAFILILMKPMKLGVCSGHVVAPLKLRSCLSLKEVGPYISPASSRRDNAAARVICAAFSPPRHRAAMSRTRSLASRTWACHGAVAGG